MKTIAPIAKSNFVIVKGPTNVHNEKWLFIIQSCCDSNIASLAITSSSYLLEINKTSLVKKISRKGISYAIGNSSITIASITNKKLTAIREKRALGVSTLLITDKSIQPQSQSREESGLLTTSHSAIYCFRLIKSQTSDCMLLLNLCFNIIQHTLHGKQVFVLYPRFGLSHHSIPTPT